MTYNGIAKGTTIELEEPLPYAAGQRITVSIEVVASPRAGSLRAIREAMQALPHLRPEDVDELERGLKDAKLPVRQDGVFDSAGSAEQGR